MYIIVNAIAEATTGVSPSNRRPIPVLAASVSSGSETM